MLSSLANGKRPVVVPRLARYGEAVDDHQVPLGRRLGEVGLVLFVEDPADLESAVLGDGSAAEAAIGMDERLVGDLRSFLLEHAARS
jgi:UDP-N-acetylglucosamine transferase subunit ALG13